MNPPSKLERDECWKARDDYFICLDNNKMWLDGIKPSSMEEILSLDTSNSTSSLYNYMTSKTIQPSKECAALRKLWELKCLPSWQQHFLTERIKEKQKRYLQQKMEKEEQERIQDGKDFWERVRK
jgi:hypothetical protein